LSEGFNGESRTRWPTDHWKPPLADQPQPEGSSLTLEIKVGPPQLTVHQGYTVMVSEPDGQIPDVSQNGLFFLDTRLICVWTLFADGVPGSC
jgi:hypothetical protein